MKKALCVVLVALSAVSLCSCFKVNIQVQDPFGTAGDSVTDAVSETIYTEASDTVATDAVATDALATDAVIPQTQATTEKDDYDIPTEAPAATAPAVTQAPEATQAAAKTPSDMNQTELLSYFNSTLNTVKSQKVGFKKSKLTSILDLQLSNSAANSLVSIVKSALLSDTADETTVNKGSSSNDVMSPSGQSFASNLTSSDISSIKASKSGDNYVIKVTVANAVNPDKDSAYGRVFDFMTVDDVVNIYAPKVGATVAREDIEVTFSDCYAELTVNGSGQIVKYTTYVKGVMNMKNATVKKVITINTDVAITLGSTTDYTDFVY